MTIIEDILQLNIKPKEKQQKLVETVLNGKIKGKDLIEFFKSSSDINKGTCSDVMKHVSEQKPEILAHFINDLFQYIYY